MKPSFCNCKFKIYRTLTYIKQNMAKTFLLLLYILLTKTAFTLLTKWTLISVGVSYSVNRVVSKPVNSNSMVIGNHFMTATDHG